ncbi:MAG: hypothetical protein R6V53_04815 [Candidatus Woesearchaeota archaeon]
MGAIKILLLEAISIIATIFIIFRLETFTTQLVLIAGFIIIGIMGLYGMFRNKAWGAGLSVFLFAALILDLMYLFFIEGADLTMAVAFLAALIGFIISISIRPKKVKRYDFMDKPEYRTTQTISAQKNQRTARNTANSTKKTKKTAKKSAKKKKTTAKKTATKKAKTTKKTAKKSAKKKTKKKSSKKTATKKKTTNQPTS